MYSILLQAQAAQPNPYAMPIMMVGIVVVFYFFMIRPQQKKAKEQKKFIEEIKKGDDVVTVAGIYGRVAEIEGETIILEVERGGRLKIAKAGISLDSTKAAFDKK